MSFLNTIGGLLTQFSGAAPEQVGAAATEHVNAMDTGELADHLTTGAQNMNAATLGQLALSLLGALRNQGHDEAKIHDAGISTGDAQAGDPDAVSALIAHAQQNPAALKDAAIDFIKNNPQAVEQFAPGFMKGILAKFTAS